MATLNVKNLPDKPYRELKGNCDDARDVCVV